MSQDILGTKDKLSSEWLVIAGAPGMAILGGWIMRNPKSERDQGASAGTGRCIPAMPISARYPVPFSCSSSWC
jgi:hypothetical protein